MMITKTVNEELTLSYPEGFREMSPGELNQLYVDQNPNRWGIRDDENGLMVCVFWHKANLFLAALSDPKNSIRGIESRMRRGLKEHDYKLLGFAEKRIGRQQSRGFRYEYRLRELNRAGEVWLLKKKTRFYTIYTYAHKPLKEEGQRILEDILASVQL